VDRIVDVDARPSWDLAVDDMEAIARAVCDAIDRGGDAVVVTHGTDTMEETAWLTELLLGPHRRSRAAIVFTGALRFIDHDSSDGPANLERAIAAAQDTAGRGLGAQVAFAGRMHDARSVVKVDASALDVFTSEGPAAGTRPPPPPPPRPLNRRVGLLKVGPVFRARVPDSVDGLVLQGTGSFHVPSAYHAEIDDLVANGVHVVLASRCLRTSAPRASNDRFLYAPGLTAEKAALALMVALGDDRDSVRVRAWWDELFGPAV
jgi:L-asparaginase